MGHMNKIDVIIYQSVLKLSSRKTKFIHCTFGRFILIIFSQILVHIYYLQLNYFIISGKYQTIVNLKEENTFFWQILFYFIKGFVSFSKKGFFESGKYPDFF